MFKPSIDVECCKRVKVESIKNDKHTLYIWFVYKFISVHLTSNYAFIYIIYEHIHTHS